MAEPRPEKGYTGGRGAWEEQEFDAVFGALDSALSGVRFPASKSELAQKVGGVNVAEDRDLPLVKYLEALPEARFQSADEVKENLRRSWHDTRALRGQGFGASEQGGVSYDRPSGGGG